MTTFLMPLSKVILPLALAAQPTAATPASSPKAAAATAPAGKATGGMKNVDAKELAALKTLNEKYRTAKSANMDVAKSVKLGLIGGERKSSGKVTIAGGQLRMELEGAEKTLLVVNKKYLYAVTYPPAELKDAAVQVIRGETSNKKTQSQVITGLLGSGGFLKNFKPTGMMQTESGEKQFFLAPMRAASEFKRAQLIVSKDGKEIREFRFWDERENETTFKFSNIVFGQPVDNSIFNYTPPANADVMNL
jgi:outer membrane lipoprotein-sorting protein